MQQSLIGRHRKARNGRRKFGRSRKCLTGLFLRQEPCPVSQTRRAPGHREAGRHLVRGSFQGQAECQHVLLHQADASAGGKTRCLRHASQRDPGGGAHGTSHGHGKTKVSMFVKIGVDLMDNLCPSGDDHLGFPTVPYPLWTAKEAKMGIVGTQSAKATTISSKGRRSSDSSTRLTGTDASKRLPGARTPGMRKIRHLDNLKLIEN